MTMTSKEKLRVVEAMLTYSRWWTEALIRAGHEPQTCVPESVQNVLRTLFPKGLE